MVTVGNGTGKLKRESIHVGWFWRHVDDMEHDHESSGWEQLLPLL
jgi:hypothetical protein